MLFSIFLDLFKLLILNKFAFQILFILINLNKLIFMHKYLPILLISIFIISCIQEPTLWPSNNSEIQAKFYKLSISDTSKLLFKEGPDFKFIDLTDSLVTKLDTIKYANPDSKTDKYFPNLQLKSVKSYSSNPIVSQYYVFDHGAVKLAGFSTGDSLVPFTSFDNPLTILPALGVKSDSSSAIKQIWSVKKNQFVKETKTKTKIKLRRTGTVIYEGQKDEFLLFELILKGDAKVSFGEKELIVPDAIYLKSQLLFSKTKGLIYEWCIKSQQSHAYSNKPDELSKNNSYIELIKYNTVNH